MFKTDGPTLPPNDPVWQYNTRPICKKCGFDYCICQLISLSPEELLGKLQKILDHQLDQNVHPLTCGNDSNHNILIPLVVAGQIELRCRDCGWIQRWNPLEGT